MSETATFGFELKIQYAGLEDDLRARLVDVDGANVGAVVSTGFVEIGTNATRVFYLFTYDGYPDGFRGGVKIYDVAAPSVILMAFAANPSDAGAVVNLTVEQTEIHVS